MMLSRLVSLIGAAYFLTGASVMGLTPTEEAALPKITRKEVLAVLDENRGVWLSKVSPGQTRLFFDDTEWRAASERIMGLSGIGAKWRESFFAAADRIVSTPMRIYVAPPKGRADAEGWQRTYGDSLVVLAAAARLSPEEKYRRKLREMVLAGCRFDTWGREGKNGEFQNMDLAAAHMARGLAVAYDWHRTLFTDVEKELIRTTFRERARCLLDGVYGNARIFWTSWYTQNHHHICNAALGIAGAAFLEEIPEAPEWLAASLVSYRKIAEVMPSDGSIFEGVMYWQYGRSFIVQYIEATKRITGADTFYNRPFLRNSIAFRLGCSVPGYKGVLLWADSRGHDACGPQHILYRLAAQYRDGQGQFLADNLPYAPQGAADAIAWTLLWYDPSVKSEAPIALDYHAESWDMLTSRSGWGDGDYMLSFKGGYNQNFHTKIDAGALSLNFGGQWLLMAPGYGIDIYGKPGFFDKAGRRWNFFSNVTESHSTLLINGHNQRSDLEAVGVIDRYVSAPSWMVAEENLSQAYHDVEKVRRRIIHRRGDYVLVLDEVKARGPATVEWLAQVPPSVRSENGGLYIQGMAGGLSILRIDAKAAPFVKREPTVSNVDVSPSWLATYSSKSFGEEMRLATLLCPHFVGQELSRFQTSLEEERGGRHIRIREKAWQDDHWLRLPAARVNVASQNPENTASALAELFSVRRSDDGKLLSLAATGATKIETGSIQMESNWPFEVALEIGKGGTVLSLGSEFKGRLLLPSGVQIFDGDGRKVAASSQMNLRSGRYVLATDVDAARAVDRWATQFYAPHPAVSPLRVSPLGGQPSLPQGSEVTWEAEANPLQSNGVAIVASRSEASNQAALVNFGCESPAHSVGWMVDVPKAGRYTLSMRYAVGQPRVEFSVLVDGAAPSSEALQSFVTGPEGWGSEIYWTLSVFDWREDFIRDSLGKPLELPLKAGRHEIRLAYPTAGLNLDVLRLRGIHPDPVH